MVNDGLPRYNQGITTAVNITQPQTKIQPQFKFWTVSNDFNQGLIVSHFSAKSILMDGWLQFRLGPDSNVLVFSGNLK